MNALKTLSAALTVSLILAGCQAPNTTGTVGSKAIGTKAVGTSPRGAQAPSQQPTQVLVKFKAQMHTSALQAFRAEFNTRNVGMIAALGIYIEEVPADVPFGTVLAAMQASPLVEYAEANGQVGIQRR